MSEWISVKDRMPDVEESVIAYSKTVDRVFVGYYDLEYSFRTDSIEPMWYLDGARGRSYAFTAKVTHWMPLPELPKEARE